MKKFYKKHLKSGGIMLFMAVAMLFSTQNAAAQTWTESTISGTSWSARQSHTSVVFDNKLWVIGGADGSRQDDVWYSSDGVSWTAATEDAPWSGRSNHTSVVFDNKLWVIGGHNGSNREDDVWSSSDGVSWTAATNNAPWSNRFGLTSVVFDNKLWVIGGHDGSYKDDVWYSSDGISWTATTEGVPWSSRYGHTSVVFDNKLWVIGGQDGGGSQDDVWYSSDGVSWTESTISGTSWSGRRNHTSVVFDNKLWVIGGTGSVYENDVWYSSDGISWTAATEGAPWSGRTGHTSVVFENKLWVIGGTDGSNEDDVWSATYSNGNSLPTNITLSGAAVAVSSPVGMAVGTLSATDTDQSAGKGGHLFTLVSGTGSTDNGSYDIIGDTLKLKTAAPSSPTTQNIRVQVTDQNGGTYEKTFNINVVTCGNITLIGSSGSFTDGSGGSDYANGLDCSWLITAAAGKFVTLSFSAFSTHASDTVKVYDGADASATLLATYSGSSIPAAITGTQMFVRFVTNSSGTSTGWSASYTTYAIWTESTISGTSWSARESHTSVVFDNKLWVIGGTDGSNEDDVWYSSDGVSWTAAAEDAPWSGRWGHSSVVFDNKLWVIGGWDGSSEEDDVWYSSDGITWNAATTNAPWSGRYYHTSVVFDNKLWVIGGNDGSGQDDVWYSSDGVSWTAATTNAPWSNRFGLTSVVFDNKLWVIGGYDGSRQDDVWYSSDGISWTAATTNAPWSDRWGHTSVVFDNKLWVIGGDDDSRQDDVWYSSDGISWTAATEDAPWSARYYHTSVVFDNKLWVIGGDDGSREDDVWSATYSNGNSLPTNITLSSATVVNIPSTAVGLLSATDTDQSAGKGGHLFTLVSGTGSTHNSSYDIIGDTLKLKTAAPSSPTTQNIRVQVTDQNGGTYEKTFNINVAACGNTTLTASSGSFTDGSGSSDYANGLDCSWLMTAASGKVVKLSFSSFSTHASDTVKVYDGADASATLLGTFSGSSIPANISSTGTQMFVRFTTDGNVTSTGWSASYTDAIWTESTISGTSWSGRRSHTSVVFDNKLWVIGGNDGSRENDVWYSSDGITWDTTTNAPWLGRSGHTSVVFDNKLWVIGGWDNNLFYEDDVWYSSDGFSWTAATENAPWSARYSHTSVVFDNKLWVIGGWDGSREDDVWYSSDGVSWTAATENAPWSDRNSHTSVVFDNKLWVIGGYDGSNEDDVWYSSDGVSWTAATENAPWSGRYNHTSVVFDNKLWVIGGADGSRQDDVWYSSDGISWTAATEDAPWSGRESHTSVVFDNKLWMIGGDDGSREDDVWSATYPNANSLPTNITLGAAVAFSSPVGTAVGTLSATDTDQSAGKGGHLFTLVSGTGSTHNSSYDIIGDTLKLKTAAPSNPTTENIRVQVTDQNGGTYEKTFNINVAACGNTIFTASSGSFTDGSDSSDYANGLDCSWLITADTGKIVTLSFSAFSTHASDTVKVYDGADASATLLGTYSGSSIPAAITGTQIFVRFVTNSSGTSTGWSASYTINDIWTESTISGTSWSGRSLHTSVVFDNKLWVIGGDDGSEEDDVWYSSDGVSWTAATEDAPWSGTAAHTSVVFDNKLWVIGGWDGSREDDVWYSSDGVSWTAATENAPWSARTGHTSVVFDNKLWVIGGRDGISSRQDDVWYSSDGVSWTAATEDAPWSGRSTHTSAVFDNKLWVIGGNNGISSLDISNREDDVWYSSDGVSWTAATEDAPWSGRNSHTSVVFDNKLWVIGGVIGGSDGIDFTRKDDVWYSSDGFSWTAATEDAPWSGRYDHTSVVFDNKLWVIGGWDGSNENDVWSATYPNNANNLPTNITLSGSDVVFSSPVGTAVGLLSATDADQSAGKGGHLFTLVSGTGSTHNGSYDIIGDTLKLKTAAPSNPTTDSIRVEVTDQNGGTYEKTLNINVVICGNITLTASSGSFMDGSGSSDYANGLDCSWLITADTGKVVNLNFSSFSTESGSDNVLVYDGADASATLLGTYSGSSIPADISSTGTQMFVRFVTNSSGTSTGWSASYTTYAIWTESTISGTSWSGRESHTSVVFDNKLWVIGGNDGSPEDDVWHSSDGVTWDTTTNAPWLGRSGHTSVVFDNKLWVIGGYDSSYQDDVWYSSDGFSWTAATEDAPWPGRESHTSVVFDNKLWVIGGTDGSRQNDVWYSSDGISWTKSTISGTSWSGRDAHTSVVFDNKLWVIGGDDGSEEDDVWYSSDGVSWTAATEDAPWSARTGHTSVVFDNKLWIIGGNEGNSSRQDDIWYSSDGITWDSTTTNAPWSGRESHTSVVFDNKLWVIGGDDGSREDDVWSATYPNANSLPTNITLGAAVAVSSPVGTAVGKLSATDTDQSSSGKGGHLFTLVSGTGSTHNSSYDIIGDTLKLKTAAPSNPTTDSIRVQVTDQNGGTYEKIFNINVAACGNTILTASSGSFTDGSDSSDYANGLDCSWLITADTGKIVTLSFSAFSTHASDTVKVYDGADASATLLGTYSGSSIPAAITSRGTQMYVRFVTNSSGTSTGWSASYTDVIWTQATEDAPWSGRDAHTSVVFDNKLWVIGGWDNSREDDVWYSSDGVSWTAATEDAPWSGRFGHTSVVFDNKLWVIGGTDGSNEDDVWYSSDGVSWTAATEDAPWSSRNSHTSVVFDNKLWVIGGDDGSEEEDVWYSSDGVSWTAATEDAPWSGRRSHTSVVFDNKLWVIGGTDGSNEDDVWYSSDGVSWTAATEDALWSGRRGHTSVVFDNKLWVIGGDDGSRQDDVWYSSDGITWTLATEEDAPWSGRERHTSVVFDNKLWVIGGYDGNSSRQDDVWSATYPNANSLPTNITLSGAEITSSNPVGTEVGLLSATDTDQSAGKGGHLFTLVSGTGSTHNGSYDIIGDTLKLKTAAPSNPTTDSIRVQVTDQNGGTYEKIFNINIAACGNTTLTASSGSFTDGSGSSDYANGLDCSWLMTAAAEKIVTLSFSSFSTESGSDNVLVYDGADASATLLGIYSGSSIPADITSTGTQMFVRFTTGGSITSTGWSASYTTPNAPTCSGTTNLTASSGSFTDGSGSSNYAHNLDCSWLITAATGKLVTLSFSSFSTESGSDNVLVYDGADASATLLGTYSGSSIPAAITSTGTQMFVRFVTNSSGTSTGWSASYTTNAIWTESTISGTSWSAIRSHTSVVFDNKLWVIGGYDGSFEDDVWYSSDGDSWTAATEDAPWSGRSGHTSVVFDNKLWVIGGIDDIRQDDVWYSSDGVSWTAATEDAPWSGRYSHRSVVFDNKLWVIGGYDGSYQDDVWYSSDGVSWTAATEDAPWSGRNSHRSVVFDNKLWVIGGRDGTNSEEDDVWYSSDGVSWTAATEDAPWSGRDFHTSVVFDNKLWVIGGTDSVYQDDVWYSSDGVSWTAATEDAPWSGRAGHTSVVFDNKLWVIGGYDGSNYDDVWSATYPNANSVPTNIVLSGADVAFSSPVGTAVGTLSATDSDQSAGGHLFTLVSGTGSTHNSSYDIAGNTLILKTAAPSNPTTDSIRVQVRDQNGGTYEKTFNIIVTCGNTTLTASSGSFTDGSGSSDYAHNLDCSWLITAAAGKLVTLSFSSFSTHASDTVKVYDGADASATLLGTYSGSSMPADITSTGTQMFVRFTTDFSGTSTGWSASYTTPNAPTCSGTTNLTASSGSFTDGSDSSDYAPNLDCSWLITADAGKIVTLSFSSFSTESGSDNVLVYDGADASATLLGTYSGSSIPASVSSIGTQMFVRFVTNSSGTSTGWSASYVTITPNETSTPTNINLSVSTVAGGSAGGTEVGTLTATDSDQTGGHGFALVSGEGDTNNANYEIDGGVLKLKVAAPSTATTHSIRVQVTDDDGLTFGKTFTITITAEGTSTPTDINLSVSTVAGGSAAGTIVGNLTATDSDQTGGHGFALVLGEGDNDNANYEIDGGVLKLKVAAPSTATTHSIRVQVTDDDGLTFGKTFTITITAEGTSTPTNINLSVSTVAGGSAGGTIVGNLTATDSDQTGGHGFALVLGEDDNDNANYEIDGGVLKLKVAAPSTATTHIIRVQVTDDDKLTFDKIFTIIITAEGTSSPTNINLSVSTVTGGSTIGTEVGNLTATDSDQTDGHGFALVLGEGDNDNANYEIDGGVLKLKVAAPSTATTHSIRVQVTDDDGLTFEKIFTITITGTITSINEISTDILVYPNPASSQLFIDYGDLEPSSFTVEILSMSGRVVIEEHSSDKINISSLNEGVYLLKIKQQDKIKTMTFLKQ